MSKNKIKNSIVVLLSIIVCYSPLFLARFWFVRNGIITHDILYLIIFPCVAWLFQITTLIFVWKLNSNTAGFAIPLVGKSKRTTLLGIVILTAATIITYGIFQIIFMKLNFVLGSMPGYYFNSRLSLLFLFSQGLHVVLLAPIIEELFWRGFVQYYLQRDLHKIAGLLLQAALFSMVHMRNFVGSFQTFLFALIVGTWRWKKKTFIPLIMAHMVFNSVSFVRMCLNTVEIQKIQSEESYLSQLEDICTPEGAVPEENALPYYIRAYDLLIDLPMGLDKKDIKKWPDDLSQEKLNLLRKWILSNEKAIAEFELGTRQPYYVRDYSNSSLDDVILPPLDKPRLLVSLILTRAELNAIDGNLSQSISDILTCMNFSRHYGGPKPLIEQLAGLGIRANALQTSFRILQKHSVDDNWLEDLKRYLEVDLSKQEPPILFSGEYLIWKELIRTTFTEKGVGDSYMPHRTITQLVNDPTYGNNYKIELWYKLRKKQTLEDLEGVFSFLNIIQKIAPADLIYSQKVFQFRLKVRAHKNPYVLLLTGGAEKRYYRAYEVASRENALLVIAAIMQYQAKNAQPPDSLSQLVLDGYLEKMPTDPYSRNSFSYEKMEHNFTLYSIGPDLEDNHGELILSTPMGKGDYLYWPVQSITSP